MRIDVEDGAGAEVENRRPEHRVEGQAERMRNFDPWMSTFLTILPLGLMTISTELPVRAPWVLKPNIRDVDVAVGPNHEAFGAALHVSA